MIWILVPAKFYYFVAELGEGALQQPVELYEFRIRGLVDAVVVDGFKERSGTRGRK